MNQREIVERIRFLFALLSGMKVGERLLNQEERLTIEICGLLWAARRVVEVADFGQSMRLFRRVAQVSKDLCGALEIFIRLLRLLQLQIKVGDSEQRLNLIGVIARITIDRSQLVVVFDSSLFVI